MSRAVPNPFGPRKTDTGYRPEPPGREEALALAEALEAHPGLFVSFQDHDALALNPRYGNECTPRAVYGFPVEWVALRARAHAAARDLSKTAFACIGFTQRPNAFVFGVTGRVLDTRAYRGFAEDAARLSALLAGGERDLVHAWTHNGSPRHGTEVDPRRMFMMTERIVDYRLGLDRSEGPYCPHPDKPEAWRRLLRSMGFVGIVDMEGMLTGDYREQVAVFDDAAIGLRETLENPCSAAAVSPPSP